MKSRFLHILGFLVPGIFLLSGCSILFVRGSGNLVTESREVSNFDRVDLSGIGQVFITQGEQESLTVETDDNVMQYIDTRLRGSTLHLSIEGSLGRAVLPTQLRFNLVVVELEGVDVSGSGRVVVANLDTDRLTVDVSGSGDVQVGSLAAQDVTVRISGSGDVEMAGQVTGQDVDISGSGKYRAGDLRSEKVAVEISGSGEATVWATEALDARLSGSATVSYYGNPALNTSTSGSGATRSLGEK